MPIQDKYQALLDRAGLQQYGSEREPDILPTEKFSTVFNTLAGNPATARHNFTNLMNEINEVDNFYTGTAFLWAFARQAVKENKPEVFDNIEPRFLKEDIAIKRIMLWTYADGLEKEGFGETVVKWLAKRKDHEQLVSKDFAIDLIICGADRLQSSFEGENRIRMPNENYRRALFGLIRLLPNGMDDVFSAKQLRHQEAECLPALNALQALHERNGMKSKPQPKNQPKG